MFEKINMTKGGYIALLFIFVLVALGFSDSVYLYQKYIHADTIHCFLLEGCNTVAQSSYSHVFGIPLPTFGVLYYCIIFIAAVYFGLMQNKLSLRFLLLCTAVGFLFSMYFVYLQGFIIQAFCIYCLMSAATSTLSFCSAIYLSNLPTVNKDAVGLGTARV